MYAIALLALAALAVARPHNHTDPVVEHPAEGPVFPREAKMPWLNPAVRCPPAERGLEKCQGTMVHCGSLPEAEAAKCFADHEPNPAPSKPWRCPANYCTAKNSDSEECRGTDFQCKTPRENLYNTEAECFADHQPKEECGGLLSYYITGTGFDCGFNADQDEPCNGTHTFCTAAGLYKKKGYKSSAECFAARHPAPGPTTTVSQ